jgi:hypothetical protein
MPTMIYSPGIKVYIDTEHNGTIDISDDLTEGNMVRRSDGVSTFTFAVQNTRRKYDGMFTPNDRIVVLMKRLTWVRVFTGYLNSVPLMTAWPKVVNMSASCSLKRLQYWYWDPYAFSTYNLTIGALLAPTKGDDENTDGGLTNLIKVVLDQVVGWPESKVHIGRIPADWFKIAEDIAREIADEARAADKVSREYQQALGTTADIAGVSSYPAGVARGSLPAGKYGPITLTKDQADIAFIIYNVGASNPRITEFDIVTGLMTAYQESRYNPESVNNRDAYPSYGIFQQTPHWGWGTIAEVKDPTYAATKFFQALAQVANRSKLSHVEAAHEVQGSAFPDEVDQWQALSEAIVAKLTTNPTAGGGKGKKPQISNTNSQGVATGQALADTAYSLVTEYKHITYDRTRTPNYNDRPPAFLDCSSLVMWTYYNTMGNNLGKMYGARDVTSITEKCRSQGSLISVKDALLTPGAVIINYNTHIELCIGGNKTVGIGSTSRPAGLRDYGPNGYDRSELATYDTGGLLPGIQYPNVGTVSVARTDNQGQAVDDGVGTYNQTPAPGGTDDRFNSIFGRAGFVPVPVDSEQQRFSSSLTGIRALLNDQPLLGGFLKNVVNASLRSFCSAPNGDFIAWFPDYYGLWGTASRMVVEPIELLDFQVDWSDDFFVTHQFTVLGFLNQIDIAEGASSVNFGQGGANALAVATYGLANIDVVSIMRALFGIETVTKKDAENFAEFIYRKFGARPDYQVIDGMIADNDDRAEFFSALYLFMRQWAYQYNAQVPLTFMPELWPGMLLQVPAFDFQGYVTTVTHSFNFGPGGGFTTQVNLAAPARLPKDHGGKAKGVNAHTLVGLPLAGGFTPGLTREEARKTLHPSVEPEPPTNYGRRLPGSDQVVW